MTIWPGGYGQSGYGKSIETNRFKRVLPMIYLSAPYTSTSELLREWRVRRCVMVMAELMATNKLVICPVVMNHEAVCTLFARATDPGRVYWQSLEERLATACDELVVLRLPGWDQSRGVRREIALFTELGRHIRFVKRVAGDDEEMPDEGRANRSCRK